MTVTKTETTDGAYTVIKWTTDLAAGAGQDSTTWDADAAGATEVEYLVVAGGGGGGYNRGGGGGAGGMLTNFGGVKKSVSGTLTITVGALGTGGKNGEAAGAGGDSTRATGREGGCGFGAGASPPAG